MTTEELGLRPEFEQLLSRWYALRQKLDDLKPLQAEERELRGQLMGMAFPDAEEGTSTMELPGGWKLKGVVKIERKVDEAALPATQEQLRSLGVNAEALIRYTPELVIKAYRGLTAEQQLVMDGALEIRRAASTVELVPPKG